MRAFLTSLAVAMPLLGIAGAASAQTVRGELIAQATGEPIAGAFVLLVDETGRRVAGDLTGADGAFRITAPAPGRYSLRAERIGYRSHTSPPFELARSEVREHRLAIEVQAVALQEIRVEAERRCVVRPEEGARLAEVWEEARKALDATALTEERALYRFRVRLYEQRLDATTLQVQEEHVRARILHGPVPFVSLPAEDLIENGFAREDRTGAVLYAPDAGVLLSEVFLDNHCFRLVGSPADEPGLVGLSFEPVGGRRVPGIEGVLWIDVRSAELRRLEFAYVRVPARFGRPTGRVEFRRLESGAWIVDRWWIRSPLVVRRLARRGRVTERVLAIKEEGAEVIEALARGRPDPVRDADPVVLAGLVFDSTAVAPLAGAAVILEGTSYREWTDADGRFRFEIPPGGYRLRVEHVSLGIGAARGAPVRGVSIGPGEERRVMLVVWTPEREEETELADGDDVARVTGTARRVPGAPVRFGGRLLDGVTGAPIAGARILVRGVAQAVSEEDGQFFLGELPQGRHIVQVEHRLYGRYRIPVDLEGWTDVHTELRLRPPRP